MPQISYGLLYSLAKSKVIVNHEGRAIYYNASNFSIEIKPSEELPGKFSKSAFEVAINIVQADPSIQAAIKHDYLEVGPMLEATVAIANKVLAEYKSQLSEDQNRDLLEEIWSFKHDP